MITYEFNKLRNLEKFKDTNSFIVSVTHNIDIPGIGFSPNEKKIERFSDYPVLLKVNTAITELTNNASAQIMKIFPKTLNSSVETVSNNSTNASKSQNIEHSSGSTNSNVNTFGVGVSANYQQAFGWGGSVSANYSHSWGHSDTVSDSTGHSNQNSVASANSSEMSIKDWSSYGYLKNNTGNTGRIIGENPEWIWSQSYPWDVIQFHDLVIDEQGNTTVNIPALIQDRILMFNENKPILLPPSLLSLFGINFIMKADWIIKFPDVITDLEKIQFSHTVTLFKASHYFSSNNENAKLVTTLNSEAEANTQAFSSDIINMGKSALIPIFGTNNNSTVIGFRDHLFDIAPTSNNCKFKIISADNRLMVTGNGFDEIMTTGFTNEDKSAKLIATFKLNDINNIYSLIIHHWLGPKSGKVILTCKINDAWTEELTVDSEEGMGGKNNLSQIDLRDFDLKSVNFHDYLKIGINTVEITVKPVSTEGSYEYCLSALGIIAPMAQ